MHTLANKARVRLRCEALEDRAVPATALAVAGGNTLIQFDTATPDVVTSIGPVTGLVGGDTIVGLDVRPATGELFALGSGSRLYVIDPATAIATQRGADGAFTLVGTSFGFDFNPAADRIRITSDADQNLRLNPNTGTLVAADGTLAYAAGDPNAAANPNVAASAYTNSFGGATATTLYDLDTTLDALIIQNPPNAGTLNTVGGLGLNAVGDAAFDIQPLTGGGNVAFAVLSTDGISSGLYSIDLSTGAATLVGAGPIGGATPLLVSGLVLVPEIVPTATLYAVDAATGNLVRFNANAPSVIVGSVPVTGLVGGDTIVGLDFRPATGQLYALGSGSRLYVIDPATAIATQVGTDGAFTLVGTVVGFDFNPVPDRIRVVTDADQNLRLNPNDGTLAATDGTLAYAAGDPNAAANPNVVASAYTNSFAGATTTTLYDLDSALDVLATQNPPNSGTLNTVGGLGLNALDVAGFDILTLAGGANVGYAALTTDGATSFLYTIDLTTGVATQVGATVIGGTTPLLVRGLTAAPAGTFQFSSATYSVGEGGTSATVTVNRTGGSEGIVSVRVATTDGTATAPGDYTAYDQVLVFAPGVTSLTVTVPVTSDALYEGDETIGLALSDATGGAVLGTPAAAVLTITEDDPQPGVTLSVSGTPLSEAGGVATVTATLSAVSALPVTINLSFSGTATSGTDFVASATSIVIPAGMTTGTVTLTAQNNAAAEANKTILVDVSGVTGGTETGTQQVTATITDDDGTMAPVPGSGGGPVAAGPAVTITRSDGSTVTVTPFAGFTGAVTTASGDVTGDGVADVIAGAGINGHVKVFDGTTGAEVRSFLAFGAYTGGTYVASGDVNNDGFDDVIVGATVNGHVKVFSGRDGTELRSFLAYAGFSGEVRVGSGDINGDGVADVITGAGSGANGHVKVFSGVDNTEIRSFLAYATFNGGIFVAGGNVNGDGRDDIVTGADANGHVKVFSGPDNAEIRSFLAFPGAFTGSARVAARPVNGDAAADILVGSGPGRSPGVRTFDGLTLALLSEESVSDPLGLGVFVG